MERGIWAHIFNKNGYTMENIIKMDDSFFQQSVNFFLDSGLIPDQEPPDDFLIALEAYNANKYTSNDKFQKFDEQSDSQHNSLKYSYNFSSQGSYEPTDSQIIREDQNEQYVITLSKMQQLEKDSQLRKAEEERKIKEEISIKKSNLETAKSKIVDKARQIPKEPAANNNSDTVSVSVILPGGRRVLRCFSSSEPAGNVYSWVSCFEELFDPIDESISIYSDDTSDANKNSSNENDNDDKAENFLTELEKKIESLGMPISFSLVQPPQVIIDEKKTLFEQKVGKRALFNVVLLDE